MASLGDRISIIIDVATTKAVSGLKDFRSAVGEAEGVTGKFKAGIGSLKSSFSGLIPSGAGLAAAITSVGVGAIKSADQISELAKRSIDLGKATGLSTEEASKWIAVADDFGMSADDLQAGLSRIAKTITSHKWGDYGIATRDASGNAKSANEIFLQTLDVLGKIPNDIERARVGNELLGKGYSALSPLIGSTRAEYEQMLGAVSAGQTLTAGEAQRAEKWRLAQDALSDATADLGLAFGNLVVAAAPALDVIAKIIGKVADLVDIAGEGDISKPLAGFAKTAADAKTKTSDLVNGFVKFARESGNARSGLDKTGAVIKEMFNWKDATGSAARFDNYKKAIRELAQSAPEQAGRVISALTELVLAAEKAGNTDLANMGFTFDSVMELGQIAADAAGGVDKLGWSIDQTGQAFTDAGPDVDDAKTRLMRFQEKATAAKNALKQLQDQIAGRSDFIHLQQTLTANAKTIKQLENDFHDNKITAEEYYNGVAEAALDSKAAVADYVSEVDDIPGDKKLELVTKLDPASPGDIVTELQTTLDNANFYAVVAGRVTIDPRTKREMEGGIPATTTGPRPRPSDNGGSTRGESASGFGRTTSGPVNITVNVPPNANLVDIGRATADALAAFYRAGGERP
jgi:hypothetical protein